MSVGVGTGTLTLNNFLNGGTVTITGDQASAANGVTIANTAFTAGTSDVANVVLSSAATIAGGTFTASKVETINITATDTDLTSANADTLTLTADTATSVKIVGNTALTLTMTGSTKVVTIDGSADTGALTVTSVGTAATTITGGSGNDSLTAATGTTADVLNGGAGNDILTNNAGLDVLTGGAGKDTFVITTAGTNSNVYSTITDASSGDTIKFANLGVETFASAKVALADTATFQNYLDTAAAGVGNVNAAVSWFQFGGNTYVVEDQSLATTFVNGTDVVVKLTGLIDLSTASFNSAGTLLLA